MKHEPEIRRILSELEQLIRDASLLGETAYSSRICGCVATLAAPVER